MDNFWDRIGCEALLDDLSKEVCNLYGFNEFSSSRLIKMGYEDFNFIISADKKYFVKIFHKDRSDSDCQRYIEIVSRCLDATVSLPKIYFSNQGMLSKLTFQGQELRLCVAEFISGKTFFELGRLPSKSEIIEISKQVAKINTVNFKPGFLYDSWAITSFEKEMELKAKYLSKEDSDLLFPLLNEFKDMKINELPHALVHGDVISTNAILDDSGKIFLIDFSVANYYPRIQELAILACNLLFDENSKENSDTNLKLALESYQQETKLTNRELEVLPTYIKLAHAMHVLCANYEKVIENNDSDENEYWLNLGRNGLKQTN